MTPGGVKKHRAASTDALLADKVTNILVAGVGGQGVIVAAAIIAEAALLHGGLEVKLSETHGMSQRGGSVQSQVRIGRHVVAPVISPGEVDYLLAFEAAEGLRLAPSLADEGVAIVNTQEIVPPLASMGEHSYPHDAIARMGARGLRVIAVDGNALAEETGSAKVAGVVLLGALSTRLAFAAETWERAIAGNVGPGWLEMNLAAFATGRKVGAAPGSAEVAAEAPPDPAGGKTAAPGVSA